MDAQWSFNLRTGVALLAIAGALLMMPGCGDSGSGERRQAAPLPVEVAEVEQGPMTEFIRATGRIEPSVRVRLATKLQGRVEEVNFSEGQAVQSGQVLIRIDAADVRARKAQAEAARSQAAASLKQLEASEREARAMLEKAESDFLRVKSLFDKKASTQEQYDGVSANFEVAQAQVQAIGAKREVLRANIAAAEAQIEEAEALLAYAELAAPISGVVTEKHVEIGDMTTPGAPLGVLEDLSQVKIELVVPEEDIPRVEPGVKADITVDALPERRFEGAVETVIPSGDPLSHAFTVKVLLDNADGALKPGMFVRAGIVKEHRDNVVKVPLDAILEEGDTQFVYRVEDGRAVRVDIPTGLRDLASVEVLDGLSAGDRVVTRGKENLTSQSRVRIVNS